jgi:hypothetical protein
VYQVIDANRSINFIARGSAELQRLVPIRAGQHSLEIPRGLFIPLAETVKCLTYFCETGSLHPDITWVRYDELGMELYADT